MARRKYDLASCNDRLKAARVGLKIYQRGDYLSLRGTLPPRPGSKSSRPSQQTIALRVMASPAGFEYAESKALEFGAMLAQRRFDWRRVEQSSGGDTCGDWIARFKKTWLRTQDGSDEVTDLRWREQFWYPAFSNLPQHKPLNADVLARCVDQWPMNSRARQIAAQKLRRLAAFAEIDATIDGGSYTQRDVKRDIPDDATIVGAIDGIKNEQWQWISGMMATFGLRDHEAFLCTLDTIDVDGELLTVARVPDDTKTGDRIAFAVPPQWLDRWNLTDVRKPSVTAKINKVYGDRTSTQFSRMKMPFRPYELRHAWSVRSALQYQLPTAVAAAFMGHDPNTNLSIYQKHISLHQSAQAYVEAIKRMQSNK